MIKKNVHRTFCPNYWDIIPNEGILASFRTFFLTRVGSYPLGSGQEMLRIMVLVHLLPSFLSLPRFYLIMGNSNSFFFSPKDFLSLLHKFCKTIKSRGEPNRINALPQLLGNIVPLAFVHLTLMFFQKGICFSID